MRAPLVIFVLAARSTQYWSLAASIERRGEIDFGSFIPIQYRLEIPDRKYDLRVSECPRYVEWCASGDCHDSECNTFARRWSTPIGPSAKLGFGLLKTALYFLGSTIEPQGQILNLVHSHWDRFSSAPSVAL